MRSGRAAWFGGFAPVCRTLIALNGAVFIAQVLTFDSGDSVTLALELDPQRTIHGLQLWRILTSAFCHEPTELLHIGVNMFVLWQFGPLLEVQRGSREFLAFYLAAAVVSSLGYLALAAALGNPVSAIGASGAVCGVFMLFAMHYPRQRVLLFLVVPIEIRWALLGYLAWDLYPVLREIGGAESLDGVAHSGHLGGLLFGFLYFRSGLRITGVRTKRFFGPRLRLVDNQASPPRPVAVDTHPKLRLYVEPKDEKPEP